MAKKKRTPSLYRIREVGPFKASEEMEREVNKVLAEMARTGAFVKDVQTVAAPLGRIYIITYREGRMKSPIDSLGGEK
jgi:uncharacterized membrane protein